MKAKKFLCKVFTGIFAVCLLLGVCVMKTSETPVVAETTTTDVTEKVKMSLYNGLGSTSWNGTNVQWWQCHLTFDGISDTLPAGCTTANYYVNDNATKYTTQDLMQYIIVDQVEAPANNPNASYMGKTTREIVTANATKKLDKAYGGASVGLGDGFAPITVQFTGNTIYVRGCNEFIDRTNLSITLKAGYTYAVSDTQTLTWNRDVTYAYQNGTFSEVIKEVDVTEKAVMKFNSKSATVVEIGLTFDGVSNVLPAGTSSFFVNDHASTGSVDLMQYIKIGDKTSRDIVKNNTQYSGVVGNLGGVFAPIAVQVDNNGIIRIKTLLAYCQYENLEITLVGGLKWTSTTAQGKVSYTTSKDVTYRYINGYFYNVEKTVNVSDKIGLSIQNTTNNTPAKDGTYTTIFMSFDGIDQVLHKAASGSFWVNDNATNNSNGIDLMQYIYVNGNSARAIVSSNKIFTGLVLSSTVFGPVAVADYDGKNIQILVRNDYINYSDLFITLKGGLAWETKAGKLLTTDKDQTFCVKANSTVFENVETALQNDTFAMKEGASIKKSGYAGIRFSALYNAEELDYWMNNKGCKVEVGMLLTKQSLLGANELTATFDKQVSIVCSNNNPESKEGAYRFDGGISPVVNESSYSVAYVGRAYMKITVGNMVFYKYATVNDNVRSIAYVAQECLNKDTLTETERTFLQQIVDAAA